MKNKKFADEWENLSISEETENRIMNKIQQKLRPQKKHFKLKLRMAIIASAIFVMLSVTVIANAPLFKMFDNLSATVTQNGLNNIGGVDHNITVDSISISPFGNMIMLTEKAGSNSEKELFDDFFIVDDKGNFYGHVMNGYLSARKDWDEDKTFTVDFYGNVPSDAQYLKLIPCNFEKISQVATSDSGEPIYVGAPEDEEYYRSLLDPREFYLESKYDISSLPCSFKQSEYGNILIESCVVTDEDITVTYRYEGMVKEPFISPTDGKNSISPNGELSHQLPVYNSETDSYTLVFTFNKPIPNVKELVKGLIVSQYDIELLEEQAITIPLK